jgi:Holliday junction resolvase RusA-like endonuclease
LDNLGKSISDALNGIVYEDDSQIVEMNIKKDYAYRNLIEVEIMPLRLHSANQVQRDDVA